MAAATRRAFLGHFLRNAPFAVLNSSLPGLMNYLITLFLVFRLTSADAGVYRLLFSYYSLFGILTAQESSKVVVRATEECNRLALLQVLCMRIAITILSFILVVAAYSAISLAEGHKVDLGIIVLLAIAAPFFALDLYQPFLQAQEKFALLFAGESIKYLAALSAFLASLRCGLTLEWSVILQLAVLASFNSLFFLYHMGSYLRGVWLERSDSGLLIGRASQDAIRLSVGAALPSSLEFVDKILLGRFLSLTALGNYALGFSTGRLVYNALKPALYIYYRQFVDRMPPARIVRLVFVLFSCIGAVGAVLFTVTVELLPWLSRYRGSVAVTDIILLSYGAQMADSLYTQAFSINRRSNANLILVANLVSSCLCLIAFLGCIALAGDFAAIAIAGSFTLNTLRGPIVVFLKRRSGKSRLTE